MKSKALPPISYPAPSWTISVNVTGGGDAFMAGLAHAWLQEQDIVETTRFALGCAALTVNCSDTVFSGLSKAAVERMLEEYPC